MNDARAWWLIFSAMVYPACAPPTKCAAAPAARATAEASAPSAAAVPDGPEARAAITLHAVPGASAVEVEVRVKAEAEALARFSLVHPAGAAALRVKGARDDQGAMEVKAEAREGRVVIALPRRASGEVQVRYTVDAATRPGSSWLGVDPDANRFLAEGEPLLLLPDGLDDRPVRATITFDFERYVTHNDQGPNLETAASSFGVGASREVTARGRELRRAVYLAGMMGRARFEAIEGYDEAVWIGYTSFDPRPIAADVAAFRTATRELFRAPGDGPMTLVIAPDNRPAGAFAASRRARSVLVRVGSGEPWTAPVRIAVAAEVLHAWIGERLWIGPDAPGREAEAYWFTEGVTRYLARDLNFRFGLITSRELLDEVHGLLGIAATSPWKNARNAELASRAKQAGAVPLLVARGALYATALRSRLRGKSGGKTGIEDLLRPLFEKAKSARGPLPESAWIEAVSAELGSNEALIFTRAISEGKLDDLPDDALGPCFRRAPRTYEAFDLGFDEDATRAAADHKIAGLREGGPAARAGLTSNDVLVEAVIARGRSESPVTLTVERGGERKTIKYLPAGARVKGMGFTRKQDVPEDLCAK